MILKKTHVILCLFIIILTSNIGDTKSKTEEVERAEKFNLGANVLSKMIGARLSDWVNALKGALPGFSLDNFEVYSVHRYPQAYFSTSSQKDIDDIRKEYGSDLYWVHEKIKASVNKFVKNDPQHLIYAYSPNGLKILSYLSGMYDFNNDSKKYEYKGGDDSSNLVLLDFEKKLSIQINPYIPTGNFSLEDAVWIDDNIFIYTGPDF